MHRAAAGGGAWGCGHRFDERGGLDESHMRPYVRNVVIACPEGSWDESRKRWDGPPRDLALFYAELLGMAIIREDWLKIARPDGSYPHLAFGDGPTHNYLPPRWGDPERPQQLHLEIPAYDLDAGEELALRLGATKVADRGGHRIYADPVGHPFWLYADTTLAPDAGAPLTGRIARVVFDCFSPRALANFWGDLLTMPVRVEDSPTRVVIASADGRLPMLGFDHAVVPAPRWPDSMYPQQIHLDLDFDDGENAEALAERLGAIRLPAIGGSCPVYADPSAHPFCICREGQ